MPNKGDKRVVNKALFLVIATAGALAACQQDAPQIAQAQSPSPAAAAPVSQAPVAEVAKPKAADELKAEPEKGNEDFPMSHMTWSATLLEIKGKDTEDASAIGRVTRVNAAEYCERDPGGETGGTKAGIERCVESLLSAEKGKLYSISANCVKKAITTSHLGSFSFTGTFEDSEGSPVVPWKNDDTGEVPSGGAGGGDTVDAQFAVVCPSFKTWQ